MRLDGDGGQDVCARCSSVISFPVPVWTSFTAVPFLHLWCCRWVHKMEVLKAVIRWVEPGGGASLHWQIIMRVKGICCWLVWCYPHHKVRIEMVRSQGFTVLIQNQRSIPRSFQFQSSRSKAGSARYPCTSDSLTHFFKFGINTDLDSTMSWPEFGGQCQRDNNIFFLGSLLNKLCGHYSTPWLKNSNFIGAQRQNRCNI